MYEVWRICTGLWSRRGGGSAGGGTPLTPPDAVTVRVIRVTQKTSFLFKPMPNDSAGLRLRAGQAWINSMWQCRKFTSKQCCREKVSFNECCDCILWYNLSSAWTWSDERNHLGTTVVLRHYKSVFPKRSNVRLPGAVIQACVKSNPEHGQITVSANGGRAALSQLQTCVAKEIQALKQLTEQLCFQLDLWPSLKVIHI